MSSVITTDGKTRLNELAGEESGLVIDRMVLALIPDLDTSTTPDRDQQLPDDDYIVYTYSIPDDYKGYVDDDQVVYSMLLGSDIGDFSFNWIGLLEADTDTVITVTETPESSKWASDVSSNTTGNSITRNVILAYQDAQNLTGITVTAKTWQVDYQADFNTHVALQVDPTSDDKEELKHLTDAQAKAWQDHLSDTDDPHEIGYTATDVLKKLRTVDKDDAGINATTLQGETPDAFADADHVHTVTQIGTRTEVGTWAITGVKVYKPLIVGLYAGGISTQAGVTIHVNGSLIGRMGSTASSDYLYRLCANANAQYQTGPSMVLVPTHATVTIYVVTQTSGSVLYAYQ